MKIADILFDQWHLTSLHGSMTRRHTTLFLLDVPRMLCHFSRRVGFLGRSLRRCALCVCLCKCTCIFAHTRMRMRVYARSCMCAHMLACLCARRCAQLCVSMDSVNLCACAARQRRTMHFFQLCPTTKPSSEGKWVSDPKDAYVRQLKNPEHFAHLSSDLSCVCVRSCILRLAVLCLVCAYALACCVLAVLCLVCAYTFACCVLAGLGPGQHTPLRLPGPPLLPQSHGPHRHRPDSACALLTAYAHEEQHTRVPCSQHMYMRDSTRVCPAHSIRT